MRWTESLAIGIPQVDTQHRRLFEQVARLDEDLLAGDRLAVGGALAFLREYALEHFEAEERLMREIAFPEYGEHKAKHDAFVERVLALGQQLEEHGADTLLQLRLQNWIAGWLEVHVSEEDVRIGRHFARTRRSA